MDEAGAGDTIASNAGQQANVEGQRGGASRGARRVTYFPSSAR
jgi:hypothetical protein